jgi:hypothetical protein
MTVPQGTIPAGTALDALPARPSCRKEPEMPDLLTILQNTPAWVYALFAILLALGVVSLRTRMVKVWRPLMAPMVFILWGIYGLAVRLDGSGLLPLYWAGAAATAAFLAWYGTDLDTMEPDPAQGRVRIKGSAFPLIRNMVLFFAKYTVAVAIAYAAFDRQVLYALDVAVSGVSVGYFAGWTLRFGQRYRRHAMPA